MVDLKIKYCGDVSFVIGRSVIPSSFFCSFEAFDHTFQLQANFSAMPNLKKAKQAKRRSGSIEDQLRYRPSPSFRHRRRRRRLRRVVSSYRGGDGIQRRRASRCFGVFFFTDLKDENGNEYAEFNELTDDQIDSVKWNCTRSRKFGLVAYNECLEKFINKAEGGTLFADENPKLKPKSNIESLEQSVVYIEVVLYNKKEKKEFPLGSGSGVIITKKEIATNCHVAMMGPNKKVIDRLIEIKWTADDLKKIIWIKTINGKDWAEAKLIKKNEKKDICIIQHDPKDLFKISYP